MKTRELTELLVYIVIITVLAFTPLGFLQVGPIAITTIHLPVLIATFHLGLKKGLFLGFYFGCMSMLRASVTVDATSVFFSPLYGGWTAAAIAVLPRVLFVLVAYFTYKWFKNRAVSSFLATVSHTFMVLAAIFFVINPLAGFNFVTFIQWAIPVNGVFEAIVALIVVPVVTQSILKYKKIK